MRLFVNVAILLNLLTLGAAVHAMVGGEPLQAAVLVLAGGLNLFALSRLQPRHLPKGEEDPTVSLGGRLAVMMLNLIGVFLGGVSVMFALAVLWRDPTPEQAAAMSLPEGLSVEQHVEAMRAVARVNTLRAGALLLGCGAAGAAMLASQWRADFGRKAEARGDDAPAS